MAVINIRPQVLDLMLYAGDGVEFRLICTDTGNAPVDITGGVRAQIRSDRVTDEPPIAEFSVGLVDAYQGIIVVSLTGEQTRQLVAEKDPFIGVWDCQWEPANSEPRTLCQGKVECVADVSR
jgi:hypothetical protein